MWKTVKHLLLKLHERKLGSFTHVKVTHLNFFTPIHLSDSFCVASLMFYIETSFFLECNDHWWVFLIHHLILTNDSSLFLNFYLSVIHLHEFIYAMYSSELIQIRKIPELYFLIYELGISIYTAGKCSILQVTCFPLG